MSNENQTNFLSKNIQFFSQESCKSKKRKKKKKIRASVYVYFLHVNIKIFRFVQDLLDCDLDCNIMTSSAPLTRFLFKYATTRIRIKTIWNETYKIVLKISCVVRITNHKSHEMLWLWKLWHSCHDNSNDTSLLSTL